MAASRYMIAVPAGVGIAAGLLLLMLLDPRGDHPLVIGLFFGVLFGHTTVSAFWLGLGAGPIWARLALSLVWVAALVTALQSNVHDTPPAEMMVVIAICLAGQWFVVQLPLWLLALTSRWRLRHQSGLGPGSLPAGQFNIRQLMLLTAIVAVVFGVGRAVFGSLRLQEHTVAYDMPVFVFLAVVAILVSVPLALASFLERFAVPAAVGLLVLIGLLSWLEAPLFRMTMPRPGPDLTWHLFSLNYFTAGWVLAFAIAARLSGYRLVTGSSDAGRLG